MSESQVMRRAFYSRALGKEKNYTVYLPKSYYENQTLRYSILYLLPGLMDYDLTWFEKGHVKEHADRLVSEGKIGEFIIISADKDDAALDINRRHEFSEYLAEDLRNHINSEFRTIAVRQHCGIEGLSLGAGWAVRMGIQYPQYYSSIGALSGGFGDEAYNTIWKRKDELKQMGMRFRVGAGKGEPEIIPGSQHFVNFIKDLGFYCELELSEGPHDWPLWEQQIYNSLQFHYYSFNH